MAPAAGEQFLGVDGVLTRTVAETALALDLLAGPELGDASWAPPPAEPFADARGASRAPLRIGLLPRRRRCPTSTLDPECERAAREAAALLEELGHTVEEVAPPFQRRGHARRSPRCSGRWTAR